VGDFRTIAWTAGVVPVLAALCVEIVRSFWKGDVGLDIVAALSMSAALLFGETLAAAVVALMHSGGTFFESFAQSRARREMSDLLSRVPRTATRYRNGALDEVPLDDIAPGDLLLIRQADVAPVDGTVESAGAMLDQSALTGESMPARVEHGQDVMSGSTNAGEAFDFRVTLRAADSTYAGFVRLVEAAQKSKAPMARLANRYSLLFLIVTMTLATAAWWFWSPPGFSEPIPRQTDGYQTGRTQFGVAIAEHRALRLRLQFFPGVAVNSASATHTLVAMAMSWTLTHSSGPWMFAIPVKMFGVGTPFSVSLDPSVPPRIGTEKCSTPETRQASRANSTGVMSSSSQYRMLRYCSVIVHSMRARGSVF
jgi:hypothetical protein